MLLCCACVASNTPVQQGDAGSACDNAWSQAQRRALMANILSPCLLPWACLCPPPFQSAPTLLGQEAAALPSTHLCHSQARHVHAAPVVKIDHAAGAGRGRRVGSKLILDVRQGAVV